MWHNFAVAEKVHSSHSEEGALDARASTFRSIALHLELLTTATVQRYHRRRHAHPVPPTPRAAFNLRTVTSDCCAIANRGHIAAQCLRWPRPRPYTRATSQQMHIDPGPATRKDTAESAKAAIAAACQQTRAEGRMPEGRHNEAQEAQLWREEDC